MSFNSLPSMLPPRRGISMSGEPSSDVHCTFCVIIVSVIFLRLMLYNYSPDIIFELYMSLYIHNGAGA